MDKLQLIGSLLSLVVLLGGLYVAYRLSRDDFLMKLVGFAFASLVLLLLCDKLIAMKTDILTEKQSDELLRYIENMMWALVGAYLKDRFNNNKNSQT